MSTVPNFLDFTINAVLRPTYIRKLCYKLPSIVTFTFIQIFFYQNCSFYWMASKFPRLFERQNSRYFRCPVWKEKLIKKQTNMKTETHKLYSKVFWIFLPNLSKIDPYNCELYRFKVGAFFETQCIHENGKYHRIRQSGLLAFRFHRGWPKKVIPHLRQILTDFQNFFNHQFLWKIV